MSPTSPSDAKIQKPIIFSIPHMTPDVRLQVFDQPFHVHSMVLRIHSSFFRTFLDSADKANIATTSSAFPYDYVTELDADRQGWNLVRSEKKVSFYTAARSWVMIREHQKGVLHTCKHIIIFSEQAFVLFDNFGL
jgi:hypothetical protein